MTRIRTHNNRRRRAAMSPRQRRASAMFHHIRWHKRAYRIANRWIKELAAQTKTRVREVGDLHDTEFPSWNLYDKLSADLGVSREDAKMIAYGALYDQSPIRAARQAVKNHPLFMSTMYGTSGKLGDLLKWPSTLSGMRSPRSTN